MAGMLNIVYINVSFLLSSAGRLNPRELIRMLSFWAGRSVNLVGANSESGFKQCLPLAYNRDNRKRTIFAHVFARVKDFQVKGQDNFNFKGSFPGTL